MKTAFKFALCAMVLCCANSFSAEDVKHPDWVPMFPDVKLEVLNVKKLKEGGEEVILYFTTTKTPDEVAEFYSKGFEKAGFAKPEAATINEDGHKQRNIKASDDKRALFFSARLEKDAKETQVNVVYVVKG